MNMARKKPEKADLGTKAKLTAEQAAALADWAAKAIVAAEQLGIKKTPVEHFWLSPAQREVLRLVPGLATTIKNKLGENTSCFTVAEVATMTMALAEDLLASDAKKQLAHLLVAKHLMERLEEQICGPAKPNVSEVKKPKAKADAGELYQFKITLTDTMPPIWRRIQVPDCTLDELHEFIQLAMGWTNSHLHQFEIDGKRYGDPELLDAGFNDFDCIDSTETKIGDIVPRSGKRFRFTYEYDFGDGWQHEILFEGTPKPEPGKKYPLCLEGERACPPEDVGGVWGFAEFLEAIGNPEHDRHDELLEWSGPFDPEAFDPVAATKAMRKGLPNWRD
jgi:hypothetical protein